MTSSSRLIVRRRQGDIETPVGVLLKIGHDSAGSFILESIAGGERLGRYSLVGTRPDRWFRILDGQAQIATRPDFSDATDIDESPVDALRNFVNSVRVNQDSDLPPMASGAFGYIGYDMVQYFEPVNITGINTLNAPETLLVVPKVMILFDHVYQEMILIGRVEGDQDSQSIESLLDKIEEEIQQAAPIIYKHCKHSDHEFASNTSRQEYATTVETARDYIKAGDIFQVVPSRRFSSKFHLNSISYYRALRRLNPSAFMFHMVLGDTTIVGSSPEILVRVRDGKVIIRPLAGTRPCSGDNEIDDQRKMDLLNDEKELAEHLMLLDLGRNDVGRVAAYGSVSVTENFNVERYSHVMHIVSQVEGKLRDGIEAVDALIAGFPAGTVSGAPKIRAMQIIDELEKERRGIYGGAVGYFGWNGEMDTCIALRTAVIRDDTIYIQAGGGVVLDSVPDTEFEETAHKANALMKAIELASEYES